MNGPTRTRSRAIAVAVVLAVVAAAAAVYVLSRAKGPHTERVAVLAAKPRPTVMGWAVGVTDVAHGFDDPFGVALDRAGNVYVSDGGNRNHVRKIAPDGATVVLAGGREGFADGAGGAAAFHTPSGIALDLKGNVLVADTGNNAIRVISAQGVVTTLAGDGTAGFADGPGKQARFNGPTGVAVDALGNVFVTDTYNDRIRKIAPDGSVSTVAGGVAAGLLDGPAGAALFDTPTGLALDVQGNLFIADHLPELAGRAAASAERAVRQEIRSRPFRSRLDADRRSGMNDAG